MNLSPALNQARKNAAAERSWCLLHPEQVIEICKEREQIRALVEQALARLADHYLEALRAVLLEIQELVNET